MTTTTTTNLNKLAAVCRAESIMSKTARRALLRQHGYKQSALPELETLINAQRTVRLARNMMLYKCGCLPRKHITVDGAAYDAHERIGRPKLYRLPLGTPASRREALIRHELGLYVRGFLRFATHGDLNIRVGDAPSVEQIESLDYSICRGAHRGRPCRVQDTTITAPVNWRKTVFARGLAGLDGLVTLRAEQIAPNVYKAAWIEQGRGTSLRLVHGWIAATRLPNKMHLAYHSTDSAAHAQNGLLKKYTKWLEQNGSASTDSAFFKAALKNDKPQ